MRTVAAAVILAIVASPAGAGDALPEDLEAYYSALRQPDSPGVSCCGWGDAYRADDTEPCPVLGPACAVVAIITDTRPNTIRLKSGRVIRRTPVAVGTRVMVPPHKVRRPAQPNPTGHNLIFLGTGLDVLCWEPQPRS